MAETVGLVHVVDMWTTDSNRLTACTKIGPSTSDMEILLVEVSESDSEVVRDFKTSVIGALVCAKVTGTEVVAYHDDGDSQITQLRLGTS